MTFGFRSRHDTVIFSSFPIHVNDRFVPSSAQRVKKTSLIRDAIHPHYRPDMNARAVALDLLILWHRASGMADELLHAHPLLPPLAPADRALVNELFYGVIRRQSALELLLNQHMTHRPRPIVWFILQLGLYQVVYTDKIPTRAAVHETVEIAKPLVSPAEIRFINAILRRLSDPPSRCRQALETIRLSQPWVYHSHPPWLWTRWEKHWGRESTEQLCLWNNTPPPLSARINSLRPPSDTTGAQSFPDHAGCVLITDYAAFINNTGWREGGYYIQDPSTLIAVDMLDPQPGESVLDMCSAPGGKTTYIAQKMQNRGRIIAADSSNNRLGLVAQNCKRLGIEIVATLSCEGTRLDRCLRGERFDRILVDAPCSNTGVLRRRPDLRWRIEQAEITRLASLQFHLLEAAVQLIRPRGVIVYSTCSLEPEENHQVMERFLTAYPAFDLESVKAVFPPHDNMDGMYAARLRCTRSTRSGSPHCGR